MPPPDFSNPYAPPQMEAVPFVAASGDLYRTVDLSEALGRLHAHVADPRNIEADRKAAGGRVRAVAWGLLAIGAVLGVVMMAFGGSSGGAIFGYIAGAVLVLFGFLVLAVDLSLTSRTKPAPPEKALRSAFKAIAMGRYGYSWACLCPSARDQTVASPDLRPVQTMPGAFPLRGEADLKAYVSSFARTSGSVMRAMAVKRVIVGQLEGDVAHLQVELHFQSWPRWVNIVAVVGFVIFRPLVIIGAIGYFATRKRLTVHVSKTMLRAQNGVWYVGNGDVLEGRAAG